MSRGFRSNEAKQLLFSIFSASLVIPIFSIFLPLLALKIGATPFEVGLVGGATWFTYWFMPLIWGQVSDSATGRRFMVMAAVSIILVDALFYSRVTNPVALIVVRVSEGVAWAMFWPSVQAKMSRLMSTDAGRTFSVLDLAWAGGTLLGPTIGTVGALFLSLPQTFLLAAGILAMVLVSNIPSAIYAPKPQLEASGEHSSAQRGRVSKIPSELRGILAIGNPRRTVQVTICIAAGILTAGSTYTVLTFLGPYAESLGYSIAVIGEVFTASYLARMLVYVLATNNKVRSAFFQERRRNKTAVASTLLACAAPLVLFAGPGVSVFYAAVILVAIGSNLGGVMVQVVIIGGAREEEKGLAAGLSESTAGVGASIGPVVGGIFAETSLRYSFLVPIIGFLIFALLFLIGRKNRYFVPRRENQEVAEPVLPSTAS